MLSNMKPAGRFRYVVLALMLSAAAFAAAQVETIDARARGTSTQMGKDFDLRISIDQFSTQADRQALIDAFRTGGHDALVRTLAKMKSVGRIRPPETTGFPIAYARSTPTPTGRKILFVTDRVLAFGENANNARSKGYDVTAGEIEINDQDPSKSTGVFYPAVKVIMSKEGELRLELFQNPWKLTNITDWTPKNKEQ